MCVVSAVLDHGQRQWPEPWPSTFPQTYPQTWPTSVPTRRELDDYKKLVEDAKRIDEATGQPDCELDEKVAWMKRLEERVDSLEASLKPAPPTSFEIENTKIAIADTIDFLNDTADSARALAEKLSAALRGISNE